MCISQQASISRMVEKYNQVNSKFVDNPCVVGQFLSKIEEKDSRMVNRPYRSLVGWLLYIANGTRPDIAFAVSQLSRHLENSSEEHWNAAIRVLRYLKSTISTGKCFGTNESQIQLTSFCDADWVSNKDNRKSTSGFMVMLNSSPVVYKSKVQQSVALSTAEAEYIALSLCIQESLWTRNLLSEIGVRDIASTIVYEDNQSAIAIAMNNGYQSRAKHIDIIYHFIREQVQRGNVEIKYIESKDQLADFLTKAISTKQLQKFVRKSNVRNCTSRGSVAMKSANHYIGKGFRQSDADMRSQETMYRQWIIFHRSRFIQRSL